MKKSKLIISLGLLIVGIILIIIAMANFNSDNNVIDNKPPLNDNKLICEFTNFIIDNTSENEIKLSLDIENTSLKDISNEQMVINFYQGSDLLYEFFYDIVKLESYSTITINTTLNFEYEYLDKYEVVINNQKKEIKPYIINNNSN